MATPFYITTPIYYVNDVPHIGHAYTTIAADVLARYGRLQGHDVFFLTGVDEHGQKVQQAAEKAGVPPKQYCDRLAPQFQNLWKTLAISNDAFIRTTDAQHQAIVKKYLQQLYDKGLIYRDQYTGWYCTFDERFWTEKDVVGGLCPDCKRPVERLTESNYFFKMSQYQARLIEYIHTHADFIQPRTRRNEVLGFLQKTLEDLSISRPKSRLSWGIELPFDRQYVTYVWFDALVNYVSALDYLARSPSFDRYWPAAVHLVGKDILTTHAVYWSTILMALDIPLPQTIFAHGWWTVNGEKMSKSRGNVVDPFATTAKVGTDAFRYFLLREVPFGQDGDFSHETFVGRINSDLANGLGNLLSRTLTLIERSSGGTVPQSHPSQETDQDRALRTAGLEMLHGALPRHLSRDTLEFNRALEAIWGVIQLANQYIDKTAPWTLAKKPDLRPRLDTVLYHAAETLRILSLALYPFMPRAAEELSAQVGLGLDFTSPLLAEQVRWGGLAPGTQVAKGNPLFPRVDEGIFSEGAQQVSDTHAPAQTGPTSPSPPSGGDQRITIEDFQKIQLKTAKIVSAERVPRSEKLIKLQVDLGGESRQVVAGIGKKYEPEALVGRTIVLVANLKPAKLMGIESQGMVLAAGEKDVIELVTFSDDVPPGIKVK